MSVGPTVGGDQLILTSSADVTYLLY